MICELMIVAVERHFPSLKVPHRLNWLSENGSAYFARQMAQVAAALGTVLRFTAVHSPHSIRKNPTCRIPFIIEATFLS
jgi:putative transposase